MFEISVENEVTTPVYGATELSSNCCTAAIFQMPIRFVGLRRID